MTNPSCPRCHGWGFVPGVVPMQICDEPYKDSKSGVCTPRTKFKRFAPAEQEAL